MTRKVLAGTGANSPIHLLLPQRLDGLSVRAVFVIRSGRDAQGEITFTSGALVTLGAGNCHIPHHLGMRTTEFSRIERCRPKYLGQLVGGARTAGRQTGKRRLGETEVLGDFPAPLRAEGLERSHIGLPLQPTAKYRE